MIRKTIEKNQENQRLDRFLKKLYKKASLSFIYKLIRKDVKINGKRVKEDYMLQNGDQIDIYILEEEATKLEERRKVHRSTIKKQFNIVYENQNIIIVNKPFGLLTHGDQVEKKNHLANQVVDYLIEKGDYNPRVDITFTPAPVNRLDRNTTGLVIFGKTAEAVRTLSKALKERNQIEKRYLTIVGGKLEKSLHLKDAMIKDHNRNKVRVIPIKDMDKESDTNSRRKTVNNSREEAEAKESKEIETLVTPISTGEKFTLIEVTLVTGRTHQIRSHLQWAGYPLIGDGKYGNLETNKEIKKKYGVTTQLLHSHRLLFAEEIANKLELEKREIECQPDKTFEEITKALCK